MKQTSKQLCKLLGYFSLIVMVSCSIEDGNELSYLDINVESMDNLSIEHWPVIEEAQKRLDPYVQVVDGKYELPSASCNAVNISPSLFSIMNELMNYTNEKVKREGLIIGEDHLARSSTTRAFRLPEGEPLAQWESTTSTSWGGVEITVTRMNQEGAFDYYSSHTLTDTIGNIIVGSAAGVLSVSTWVGIAVSGGIAWYTYSIGSAIFDAARNGGITVTTTWKPMGINPGWRTTITDSNGNHIASF